MGVQACRLPALKRSKPLQPLQVHFHGFLWASSAGKSYPKARSIAFSRRSSVPLARHSQPTGIRHQAFKPAVYYFFPSQRRPWQKTGSQRPFDGQFALSSRHWPHSLCTRGKRKHTLFPSQRRPSQKTYPKARSMASSGRSSRPFTTFLLHHAVLDRKLVPTGRSMVNLPCLHVTGHIPLMGGSAAPGR